MPATSHLLTLVALVALTVPAVAQTVNLRPGKYEVTAEMHGATMPMIAPQKDSQCITAEDLKDLSKAMMKGEEAENCKVSDYKVSGNKVTFNTTCVEDGERYTMSSEMTFAGDSYTGLMKSNHPEFAMTIKTTAKRVGDCVQ